MNGEKVQSSELYDDDIVEFGNELNLRVCAFSLKKRASDVTEHEDSTIVGPNRRRAEDVAGDDLESQNSDHGRTEDAHGTPDESAHSIDKPDTDFYCVHSSPRFQEFRPNRPG